MNKTEYDLALPDKLLYPAPMSKRAMITRRENVFKNSDGANANIGPNSLITFTIPPTNNLLVPSETYFTWRVKTGDAGSDIRGNTQRLIRRLRIMNTNGEILEDISEFNTLNELVQMAHFNDDHLYDYLQPEGMYKAYQTTGGFGYEEDDVVVRNCTGTAFAYTDAGRGIVGVASQFTKDLRVGDIITLGDADAGETASAVVETITDDLNITVSPAIGGNRTGTYMRVYRQKGTYKEDAVKARLFAGDGKLFSFQLRASGIMNLNKYIPLQHIGGLRLEITLENQATAIVGTTDSYLVNDPRIYYTLLTPSDQLASALSQASRSGKMNISYGTFDNRQYTVNSTDTSVELTKPLFRVNTIFAVKRLSAIVSNLTSNSFVFNSNNLYGTDGTVDTYYQFTHNSIYYPVDRVSSFERSYTEAVKGIGAIGDKEFAVPFRKYKSPFADSRFFIAQSFETMYECDANSGSSTKNNKSIIFQCKLSAAESTRWDFFTHFTRNMNIESTGGIVVAE
jgi:hypothetical protein